MFPYDRVPSFPPPFGIGCDRPVAMMFDTYGVIRYDGTSVFQHTHPEIPFLVGSEGCVESSDLMEYVLRQQYEGCEPDEIRAQYGYVICLFGNGFPLIVVGEFQYERRCDKTYNLC